MLHQLTWRKLIGCRLAVMLFVLLLVLSPTTAHAARRFSFNDNIAVIKQVCRDGVSFYFANSNHIGVGNQGIVTFTDKDGATLGTKTVLMTNHAGMPLDGFIVYAVGQIKWDHPLNAMTVVKMFITFYDSVRNEMRPVDDTFIVADCSLKEMPSHFAYQGQLMESNASANGQYDFRFRLYDAQTGGQQIGPDQPADALTVANGQFVATPAFGTDAFTGEPRWLEIAVKPLNADPSTYMTLTPRQQIVAVPYALQTLNLPQHNHLGEEWLGNWPLVIKGSFHSLDFTSMSDYRDTSNSNYGFVVENIHDQGSGLLATTNGQVALYGYNRSSGAGTLGFSDYGEGGAFGTRHGERIFSAYHYMNNAWQSRFFVDFSGNVVADGKMYAYDFVCYNTPCTYRTNSATFAEMLQAQTGLEAGDVLVIGPDGQLIHSTLPNASNVAGVYSTEAGFVGGYTIPQAVIADAFANVEHSSTTATVSSEVAALTPEAQQQWLVEQETAANIGKIPLAIAGVVPVKVSAENGPIMPGDLLTTSTLPGHAMKATTVDVGGIAIYRPGTMIGKALEGLAEGTGVVRVLITLQ